MTKTSRNRQKVKEKIPRIKVLVVNTWNSSSLSQEMLQIRTSDFRYKEKIALKLNSSNDKKVRYV